MEKHASTTINKVSLEAARLTARQVLDHKELESDSLEELATLYYAATEHGVSAVDALEISSGLTRGHDTPIIVHAHNLDEFFYSVIPEKVTQQIAGVNEFLRSRQNEPPRVRFGSKMYLRRPDVHMPDRLVGIDTQYTLLDEKVKELLLYDNQRLENTVRPKDELGIILHGPPGTGKSSLAKYVIAKAAELSQLSGIPVRYETFSENDLSKWVGESAKNLQKKIDLVADPSGVGILVLEDADFYLHSRDEGMNNGTKQVTNRLMQNLSGFEEVQYNNLLVIATTNKLSDLESAVKRRLSTHIEVPGFTHHNQYLALAKKKLDWSSNEVQEYISEVGFQQNLLPSMMSSLCDKISSARRGSIDEAVFSLPMSQRQEAVLNSYKSLGVSEVRHLVQNYSL